MSIVLENRFDVPPEYALAWLTDFRPDDNQRLGENPKSPLLRISREGALIVREWEEGGMRMRTQTSIESSSRWVAQLTVHTRAMKPFASGLIVETVAPLGTGTAHRVEFELRGETLAAKIMTPMMRAGIRRDLAKLFANAKREMEAQHRAGKPPTG